MRVGGSAALGLFLLLLVAPRSGAQELPVGDATLRLAGWIHAGFTTTSVERWNGGFALRRARVTLDGRLSDFVDGRLQVDVHGGEATLQDAFVRLSFDPAFRLSLGQFKRAFDSFVLDSPADVSFVELDGRIPGLATGCARAGDLCTPGALTTGLSLAFRDMGVRVEGGGGRLSWLATLTNGTGLNQRDENDAKSASGRLEWRVASRLRLGGQVALHDHPGAVADRNEAEYAGAWGLDARWGGFRDGLHLQAGVFGGENWRARSADLDHPSFLAAQVVGRWHRPLGGGRISAVEPLLRVGWTDPDRSRGSTDSLLLTPGLALYVGGSSKVAVNWDVYAPDVGDTEESWKVQAWLHF